MLLDTGPMVAFLDRSDPAHARSCDVLMCWRGQLWTSCAVVTEAMHLVKSHPAGPRKLLELLASSRLRIVPYVGFEELERAVLLMEKYADTPMDFADATLVLLAGARRTRMICTLDRRGFTTFRTRDGKPFTIVP